MIADSTPSPKRSFSRIKRESTEITPREYHVTDGGLRWKDWLWVCPANHKTLPTQDVICISGKRLVFSGESKWSPPLALAEQISRLFPNILVRLKGSNSDGLDHFVHISALRGQITEVEFIDYTGEHGEFVDVWRRFGKPVPRDEIDAANEWESAALPDAEAVSQALQEVPRRV